MLAFGTQDPHCEKSQQPHGKATCPSQQTASTKHVIEVSAFESRPKLILSRAETIGPHQTLPNREGSLSTDSGLTGLQETGNPQSAHPSTYALVQTFDHNSGKTLLRRPFGTTLGLSSHGGCAGPWPPFCPSQACWKEIHVTAGTAVVSAVETELCSPLPLQGRGGCPWMRDLIFLKCVWQVLVWQLQLRVPPLTLLLPHWPPTVLGTHRGGGWGCWQGDPGRSPAWGWVGNLSARWERVQEAQRLGKAADLRSPPERLGERQRRVGFLRYNFLPAQGSPGDPNGGPVFVREEELRAREARASRGRRRAPPRPRLPGTRAARTLAGGRAVGGETGGRPRTQSSAQTLVILPGAAAPSRARGLRSPGQLGAGACPDPSFPACTLPYKGEPLPGGGLGSRGPSMAGRGRLRVLPGSPAACPELPFIYLFWWRKAGAKFNAVGEGAAAHCRPFSAGLRLRCGGAAPAPPGHVPLQCRAQGRARTSRLRPVRAPAPGSRSGGGGGSGEGPSASSCRRGAGAGGEGKKGGTGSTPHGGRIPASEGTPPPPALEGNRQGRDARSDLGPATQWKARSPIFDVSCHKGSLGSKWNSVLPIVSANRIVTHSRLGNTWAKESLSHAPRSNLQDPLALPPSYSLPSHMCFPQVARAPLSCRSEERIVRFLSHWMPGLVIQWRNFSPLLATVEGGDGGGAHFGGLTFSPSPGPYPKLLTSVYIHTIEIFVREGGCPLGGPALPAAFTFGCRKPARLQCARAWNNDCVVGAPHPHHVLWIHSLILIIGRTTKLQSSSHHPSPFQLPHSPTVARMDLCKAPA
ncbi:hypothetical protein Cadr_000023235 [Camelus dromedarius]|uniref:Uncharacterized protein n=1 Tax=Camelus dromedarius TaxID=9838 RepID=A0A5N4CII9_CAMDR|nr:hypothetical protein Cadr_000023235 [Camelus dromedarius]